jgi:hypothetical protein
MNLRCLAVACSRRRIYRRSARPAYSEAQVVPMPARAVPQLAAGFKAELVDTDSHVQFAQRPTATCSSPPSTKSILSRN